MLAGYLALTVAALFTGAALYINVVEQPARLGLDDKAMLAEWKPAYERGALMQASLALAGFVLGAVACWQTGKLAFLAGALLMLANWPWTLLAIKPINDTLMATNPAEAGPGARSLLTKWNRLHAVRTSLGSLAVLVFLVALLEP